MTATTLLRTRLINLLLQTSSSRRRHIKCDAGRPICKNCDKSSGKFSDCEYPSGGTSNAEYLEEQISILENRIKQLENPSVDETTLLRNPYSGTAVALGPASATSHLIARESGSGIIPREIQRNLQVSVVLLNILVSDVLYSISHFLTFASEIGFFLDPTRFYNSVVTDSSNPPAQALLQTVLLLAAQLNPFSPLTEQMKDDLLLQTIKGTPQILSSNHPNNILQAIQAHVLLSQYFFLNGKKLEGRYNLTMAVSLVLAVRLHRVRSQIHRCRSYTLPFKDAIEEKEKIEAFWTVLRLNSCWTALEGATTSLQYLKPHMRVDTPWPGIPLAPDTLTVSTIQFFLANTSDGGYSAQALRAKASILLEQAFDLSNRYTAQYQQLTQHWLEACNSLRVVFQRFQFELPSIDSADSLEASRQLLIIHTLVYVTKIRIASLPPQPPSNENTRRAALESVELLRKVDLRAIEFVDPIMAILWTLVGNFFVEELSRYGRAGQSQATAWVQQELQQGLEAIFQAMTMFSTNSPLMGQQLAQLRDT
ncbi:hypothetical protein D9758_013405 [Tetrapyrgos nigripes]|uniref:Zn(2)-C6 fungal-type domain-containing protein n=1 Tax=Tetrapyrgos nigripes TaxID=182062 RepID=A0A8H5CLY3_9AGAR|nr:hypothetical protein D9758_013405 [Tetrapyrgos nigripes]